MTRRLSLAVLVCCALACAKKPEPKDAGVVEPEVPPQLTLSKDRKDLLFSFQDKDGRLKDVDSADKVPEAFRKQVVVRDLSKRPEELKADQFLYVADLTREENGAYPYAVVSRYGFDKTLRDTEGAVEDDGDGGVVIKEVVIYGTSWCGACAQARAWMKQKGIPFLDKDVEADAKAAQEMARKAKRAGINPSGVPVIDVKGHLMVGFDPGQVERWLKGS